MIFRKKKSWQQDKANPATNPETGSKDARNIISQGKFFEKATHKSEIGKSDGTYPVLLST